MLDLLEKQGYSQMLRGVAPDECLGFDQSEQASEYRAGDLILQRGTDKRRERAVGRQGSW